MTSETAKNNQDDLSRRVEAFRTVFPEFVIKDASGALRLDVERLKETFPVSEKSEFIWPGKQKAVLESRLETAKKLRPWREESRDWDKTRNAYIEGDNLDFLKIARTDLAGKVDLIYIDPPYNTGSESFVYRDDFSNSKQDVSSNWASMFYSRLLLARDFLKDSGAIFVSIDDHEYANAVKILDEAFGRENYVATIVWEMKREAKGIPPKSMCVSNHEYILCYSKNGSYRFIGDFRDVEDGFSNPDFDPRGPWKRQYLQRFGQGFREKTIVDPVTGRAYTFETPYTQEKLNRWVAEGRVIFPTPPYKYPARKEFFCEYANPYKPIVTSWGLFSTKVGSEKLKSLFDGKKVFDYSKPIDLLTTLLRRALRSDGLVMDFFAGSGTLGHAVMALNAEDGGSRQFILAQTPEPCGKKSVAYKLGYRDISAICRERLRRAGDLLLTEAADQNLDVGFRAYRIE